MANQKIAGMKSLLLRAWRERWPDVQWSINVKKLLPTGSGQENQQLAELLLNQALIGSTPNNLVLSYLKHAMCTQMVTCAAVIKSIIRYDDMAKPYCMRSLLDVVAEFAPRVSLKGTSEDSLSLARALLSLVKWLTDIMYKSVEYTDERQTMEYQPLVDRTCDLLRTLIETETSCALLHIARLEESDIFNDIEQNEVNIRNLLGQTQSANINSNVREKLDSSLKLINRIKTRNVALNGMVDVTHQPLNLSINVLLTIEAVLNPTNDIQPFVEQLIVIEQVQGLPRSVLYCELLRTCLLGSIDALTGSGDDIKWAAFTFLKLPQALVHIMGTSNDPHKQQVLENAFEKLLQYAALLNLADSKCNCDWLSTLLNELSTKYSLLPEAKVRAIVQKRQSDGTRPRQQDGLATQPSAILILRAELTVSSILKTLDADYSRNQDALLGVLCHMLSGKSFELILASAAAKGKLQSFAIKLIKFNEFAKQTPGKSAQTSALLFDITFLMLCHIVQVYGLEVILSGVENTESFFVQWATRCLPDENKYRSLEMHPPQDAAKVEILLQQFNAAGEIEADRLRWHEICQNAPYAMFEVLTAWECGAINNEQVKGIIETVKSRMCCLPVVVSTWLCSYINTIDDENRKKPLNMLQQFMRTIQPDSVTTNQYYNERSHLMVTILSKIILEVLPHNPQRLSSSVLPPTQPARTMMVETYQSVFTHSCIDIKAIHKFEHLLKVAGPRWFCEQLIKEVLSQNRVEDINKGVSLVFALFHLDLEALTICLLHNVIPSMLLGTGMAVTLLTDPRGRALAQIAVMCLITTHKMRKLLKETQSFKRKDSRKRSRADLDLDDVDDLCEESQPCKLRRLTAHDENLSLHAEGFNFGDLLASKEETETTPSYDTKDPLNKAIGNLLSLFLAIVSCNQISQKTGFVMSFIEEAVRAGPETASFILQFMPINLVSQLMKCLPAQFNTELLLNVSDLTNTVGRKVAAKVICQNSRYTKISSLQNPE